MTPRSRRIVEFVDTSILLEILEVPGKAQRPAEVRGQLRERVETRRDLILPTAAVIETGNHIHHVADGARRRQCAVQFAGFLEDSARGQAPWVLHDATWDSELLDLIRVGGATGVDLVGHATRGQDGGLGTGDLSVLAERDLYRRRRVYPARSMSASGLPTSCSSPFRGCDRMFFDRTGGRAEPVTGSP